MKVFISWSGERSKAVAEALRYWLPKVLQAVEPWVSASDIEKGARWRSDIAKELEDSSIGIICLTAENLNSQWIHFEAGALSKQQQNTYVCTFLYELEPADVREPLAQFQTTRSQKEELRKLIHTINNRLEERRLADSELNESFDVWWPKLNERLESIPSVQEALPSQRTDRDILEEILGLVRAGSRRSSPFSLRLPKARLVTTLDWTPEDAALLTDHYSFLEKQDYGKYASYLKKLKTDGEFASNALAVVKVLGFQIYPTNPDLLAADITDYFPFIAEKENENTNP
jgi:hypothetical protein